MRVWVLRLGLSGLGFRIWRLGFGVWRLGLRVATLDALNAEAPGPAPGLDKHADYAAQLEESLEPEKRLAGIGCHFPTVHRILGFRV